MNGLVVMYHYVWPDERAVPGGIRPLLLSEFERQLDWLGERFQIVCAERFLNLIRKDDGMEKPPCLLTFDDGTRDQAEVAAPVLARRKLSGVFFVLAGPMELNQMPLTHAIHWLLGQDERLAWKSFEKFAVAELGGIEALGAEAEARRIYHYESPLRARIKYAVNMALSSEAAEGVVRQAARQAGQDLDELSAGWFASAEQIAQMDGAGMTIGIHGCSHRSLQSLGGEKMGEEIRHASKYLTNLIGRRPTWWACPFGGSGAGREDVMAMNRALDEVGVVAAVTTEKKRVGIGCDPRALPRLDCIDLPPRKTVTASVGM